METNLGPSVFDDVEPIEAIDIASHGTVIMDILMAAKNPVPFEKLVGIFVSNSFDIDQFAKAYAQLIVWKFIVNEDDMVRIGTDEEVASTDIFNRLIGKMPSRS